MTTGLRALGRKIIGNPRKPGVHNFMAPIPPGVMRRVHHDPKLHSFEGESVKAGLTMITSNKSLSSLAFTIVDGEGIIHTGFKIKDGRHYKTGDIAVFGEANHTSRPAWFTTSQALTDFLRSRKEEAHLISKIMIQY